MAEKNVGISIELANMVLMMVMAETDDGDIDETMKQDVIEQIADELNVEEDEATVKFDEVHGRAKLAIAEFGEIFEDKKNG